MIGRRSLLAGAGLGMLTGCGVNVPERREAPGVTRVRHSYGEHPSQYGIVHTPTGTSRGTVVLIHGGFWSSQYRLDLEEAVAGDLAGRGWTAWNIDYRSVGNGGGWPQTGDDVAAAIDHLAGLNVDTSGVIAIGHSAGGQLAAWAASRTRPKVALAGAIAQSGVLDLVRAYKQGLGGGAVAAFLGGSPQERAASYAEASPYDLLPTTVPITCVHSPADEVVPFEQSRRYCDKAAKVGGQASLVRTTGGHFDMFDPKTPSWKATRDALELLSHV